MSPLALDHVHVAVAEHLPTALAAVDADGPALTIYLAGRVPREAGPVPFIIVHPAWDAGGEGFEDGWGPQVGAHGWIGVMVSAVGRATADTAWVLDRVRTALTADSWRGLSTDGCTIAGLRVPGPPTTPTPAGTVVNAQLVILLYLSEEPSA